MNRSAKQVQRVSPNRALSITVRMKVVLPDMFDPVSSSPVPSSVRVFAVQPSIKGCTTCTASRYLPSVNVGRQVFVSRRRRMTEMAASVRPMKRNTSWMASR